MTAQNNTPSAIRLVLREMVVPFWTSSEKRGRAWFFLFLTFAFIGTNVYCLVLLNRWNQAFYDALQNLDRAEFFKQLGIFFGVAFLYVIATVYKFFVLQLLMLDWRSWLTEKNLDSWLSHKSYYFWQLSQNTADNPDQRLSEDLRELSELVLNTGEKLFRELITFLSFIGILWALSGSFTLPHVGGYRLEFPHYLVWSCLLYAVIGTWITHKIGRPLAGLNFLQQRLEADFRYSLVRLRENSESVAATRGEGIENKNLKGRLARLIHNYRDIISKQKQILLTSNTYGQIAYIFPFLVAAPRLFAKEISLGQLFQISSAFGQVQGSVSVFVNLYPELARLKSVADRLGGLLQYLEEARHTEALARKNILFEKRGDICLKEISLATPEQKILVQHLNLVLPLGSRLLIRAPSGSGKSTLLRTLQGMWPFHGGQILVPENLRTLFLPQLPYLLTGTLKSSLTYPLPADAFPDELVQKYLEVCQLPALKLSLHIEDNWEQKLSPGEQQRIAFIRVLLHKPDLVFLDEAFSALDDATQTALYRFLIDTNPQMTLISVDHRESLRPLHSVYLDLSPFLTKG